jgi:DNA polymerase-1
MDYLLLLDADMILTGSYLQTENIRAFKKSLTKDFYHVCQGSQTYFYKNVRLVKNYKDFSYVPLDLATQYAANDAHQCLQLSDLFMPMLQKESLETLYYTIEHPLIEVLYQMEKKGIYVDTALLKTLSHHLLSLILLVSIRARRGPKS